MKKKVPKKFTQQIGRGKRSKSATPAPQYVFSDELNQRLEQYQLEVARLLNKLSVATRVVSTLCELRTAAKKEGKQ